MRTTALFIFVFAASVGTVTAQDFGDDSGEYANDNECDDTRFVGDRGGSASTTDNYVGRDATDCRNLFRAGLISWGASASGSAVPGSSSSGGSGNSDGYALCAFTATYTQEHHAYGDNRGGAWIDAVFFDEDDRIPPELEMQQAFADTIRAGEWAGWNPRYDNESVDCAINRNAAPGQGRSNEAEWEARFRSEGWNVAGIGGIYWWDSEAGRAGDLLIQNNDWRGPVNHR